MAVQYTDGISRFEAHAVDQNDMGAVQHSVYKRGGGLVRKADNYLHQMEQPRNIWCLQLELPSNNLSITCKRSQLGLPTAGIALFV